MDVDVVLEEVEPTLAATHLRQRAGEGWVEGEG